MSKAFSFFSPIVHLTDDSLKLNYEYRNLSKYTPLPPLRQEFEDTFQVFFGGFIGRILTNPLERGGYKEGFQLGISDILIVPAILDIISALIVGALSKDGGVIVGVFGVILTSPLWAISAFLRGAVSSILTVITFLCVLAKHLLAKGKDVKVDSAANVKPNQPAIDIPENQEGCTSRMKGGQVFV